MDHGSHRHIRTGDMLIWDQSNGSNSAFWLKLVRFLTVSEYGHVSIAIVRDDGLYHYEAVMPRIRLSKVSPDSSFYVLPMSQRVDASNSMTFFDDKVGKRYDILDALRAYFGVTTISDDRWQCAELAEAYYQSLGIDINIKSKTPAKLVKELMKITNLGIFNV